MIPGAPFGVPIAGNPSGSAGLDLGKSLLNAAMKTIVPGYDIATSMGAKAGEVVKDKVEDAASGWVDGVKEFLGPAMIRIGIGALGILLIVIAGFMLANPGLKIATAVSNVAKAV